MGVSFTQVLIVLSNLAVLPAIVFAYQRAYHVEATMALAAALVSAWYHTCADIGRGCPHGQADGLGRLDTILASMALVFMTIALVNAWRWHVWRAWRRAVHAVRLALLLVANALALFDPDNTRNVVVIYAISIMALLLLLAALVHVPPKSNRVCWRHAGVAMVLLALAVVAHRVAMSYDDDVVAFRAWHSVWHVFVFAALAFLIVALPDARRRASTMKHPQPRRHL